jgi:predicted dehydrogenase
LLERKDLDAVFVVTPDHWHALTAIAAMEAGLDVYCEKPLTLTIDEGKKMVATARRYGTVFQTGSMQRSDPRFRQACELVRNEKIGKLRSIHTYIGGISAGDWQPFQTPPPQLDWDFWLGPAPYADYFPKRCHYQFRWFSDYSGGKMTDWGAHHNDQAQWALGMDKSGPVEVEGTGEFHPQGPHDVPGQFEVHYKYANGVELICHSQGSNGVRYEGTDGWIFVSRSRIQASDPAILETKFGPNDIRVKDTGDSPDNWENHYADWLHCIKTRERCICDVEVGHRSVTVCHLGNIAIKLGRRLKWDPAKEEFVNDAEANMMLSRPMRAPWHL